MAEGDEKIVKFEEEPWNGSSLTNGGEFVKSSRTAGLRRKALRAAKPCLVEQESHSKKDADSMAQVKHLVKIFQNDAEIAEVSQEQVTRVKTMHASIQDGASFSFNYNTLLLVASVLAGLGLVSDSATTVVASMLISPIMGPVIGLAYGSTIRDFKLVRKSLYVEVISIGSCILIGAVVGLITGPTKLSEEWPTQQMKDRGSMTNFLVALPIAFFSGLGVAVSLLDDQTSSLVGVAISASLLPPAVNAGILWVAYLFAENDIIPVDNFNSVNDNDDSPTRHEYRKMGFLSLELTLANVGLIWISSMLMFRLKEVLPIKKKIFWEDLGVARKIYQRKAYLENVDELSEELSAEEGEENRESPRT